MVSHAASSGVVSRPANRDSLRHHPGHSTGQKVVWIGVRAGCAYQGTPRAVLRRAGAALPPHPKASYRTVSVAWCADISSWHPAAVVPTGLLTARIQQAAAIPWSCSQASLCATASSNRDRDPGIRVICFTALTLSWIHSADTRGCRGQSNDAEPSGA
jgi:hypothetical protein